MINIIVEALVVGIFTVMMGLVVHVLFGYHKKHSNSPNMKEEMVGLVITLFFTGFFLHLFFEVVGLNKYYMKIHKNDV